MSPFTVIFALIAFASVSVLLLVRWIEHRLLYRRSRHLKEQPEDHGLTYEDVPFMTQDLVRLHGWWFPAEQAKGSLIICHGNAGNISHRLWMPLGLQDTDWNIFLFDYRGYGRSRGRPTEAGTRNDVLAAYVVVQQLQNRTDLPIVVYGRSLGGAVALQLAAEEAVSGLVLESTFTSVVDMGKRFYPHLLPEYLCRNRYLGLERIKRVQAPVLVAHARCDETVPFDMGEALYAAAPNPYAFSELQGAHHESGWDSSPEFALTLRTFLRSLQ